MKNRNVTPREPCSRQPAPAPEAACPEMSLDYPAMKRRFMLVVVRQRLRAFCDRVGLGPSTGERLCCALIVGVVPFVVSFILAFAFKEPAGYAALQGVGAFVIVALFGILLIGWTTDETLESLRARLALQLPQSKIVWLEKKKEKATPATVAPADKDQLVEVSPIVSGITSVRKETKRCPYCAEEILADARKCKHCGEMLVHDLGRSKGGPTRAAAHTNVQFSQVVTVGRRKSGGVAALFELFFGFFLCTFGPGHLYAGSIGTGLFLLFGWWFFLFVNLVLAFFSCGLWAYAALVIIPAAWFLLLILSPIVAASSASDY